MRYSTRLLVLLVFALLPPVAANAQNYAYEGTITFLELSGKDCGEVKVGDSRPYTLAVSVQGAHITGFSLLQGADLGRFSGTGTGNLSVEYPDPLQSTGHGISLLGLEKSNLTGELREKALRPEEAGCNLSRGQIVAHQSASGQAAEVKQQELAQAFQSAQQEYAAKHRDPQAYARLEQLASELEFAKANSNTKMAVELRQEMRPLAEKCYGNPSRYLADLLINQVEDMETLNRDQEVLELYPLR